MSLSTHALDCQCAIVVCYSYDDDTGGLDAIAANGGTGRDRYTYVGDEEELDSAFESIIREIKACQ